MEDKEEHSESSDASPISASGKIPDGKTITEYLTGHGLERGIELTGGQRYEPSSILSVRGGRRYEVLSVMATGGMGVIYEARDLNSRRIVALKVLPKEMPAPEQDMLRFVREGQLTSQLEHPNIVPVHELGVDKDGNVFYTMKRVEGRTLTDILQSIRKKDQLVVDEFPLPRLLNIFQKVCDAVAFAHSRGVIHRDLKPDNIMIGSFGEVQVMDWGLAKISSAEHKTAPKINPEVLAEEKAKAVDPDQTRHAELRPVATDDFGETLKTISGRIMGTPGFMAPEQILHDEMPLDERADVYALGSVLYSILTLRPTISGGSVPEMLKRIVTGDFLPPIAFNEQEGDEGRKPMETKAGSARQGGLPHCPDGWIPTALSKIAMKALALHPGDRFGSVQELQQEIEGYQNGYIWHLVIDEDFSDEDFLDRWQVFGGKYALSGGELQLHDGEPQVLVLKRDVPGDVRIEFTCRVEGSYLNCIGCFINSLRSSNYREIPWSGYEFELGGYDNSRDVVHRFNEQIWIEPNTPLERGKTYEVMAERIGSHVRLVMNGEEIVNYNDPDPLSGSDRVAVGLVGWNSDMRYSHIRVTTLGTPWKADVLDLAERQIQKGRYDAAIGLFKDTLESFPDAERMRRARGGLAIARQRARLAEQLPEWTKQLKKAWPDIDVELRMVNDGLSLDICEKHVGSLAPLHGLPLNVLYCAHCGIDNLEPLAGMPLTALNCTGNPISDFRPLQGMPMKALQAENCPVKDLEPLRGMPLRLLQLGRNEVQSLEPLRGMPLTSFQCWSGRVKDLEPLRGMEIDSLNVAGNHIESLEPLRGMPLTNLHCGGNRITDLSPVHAMPLSILHCGDNQIEDLRPLVELPLSILSCHANRIKTLAPLKDLPLNAVTCGANQIEDMGPFADAPPEALLCYNESLSVKKMRDVYDRWKERPELAEHARNMAAAIAFREGDVEQMRAVASEFKGHRYLLVPRFMKWGEAKETCEKLGGHLVTITSEEIDEFISSMFESGCWFWMGLSVDKSGPHWVTGEPFEYKNYMSEMEEFALGPKVYSRFWRIDHIRDPHNCFMIEWDE